MKRIIVLILSLLIIGMSAISEIDWENLSDEDIQSIIERGQIELDKRNGNKNELIRITDGCVLLDAAGVKVVVEGEPWLSDQGDRQYIYFK